MGTADLKVLSVERHSRVELIRHLRRVSMLEDPNAFPYEHAEIEIGEIPLAFLHPCQRYVLEAELRKVQALKWALEGFGVSLLHLDGFFTIRTNQSDQEIDVLPPIVEYVPELDWRAGDYHYAINDGMHRLYMALLEFTTPQVVSICGLPEEYPYYAYPNPKGWDDVQILPGDVVPKGFIKKWHRIKENKRLYRSFNSVFLNVGGPRGQGK